jgi:hypothetical protein
MSTAYGVGYGVGLMGGGSAPSYVLPTEGLIARWHRGAGIVEGDDGGETTVASWTDVISSVVLEQTTPANQPRLPASTPTFEGDGSSVVHFLKRGNPSGLSSHTSHTIALACAPNAASGVRLFLESNNANNIIHIKASNSLLGFKAPGPGNTYSAVAADGSFRVLTLTLDAVSGEVKLYDNDTEIVSGSGYDGSATLAAAITVGTASSGAVATGYSGKVYDIPIYEGVLDADARTQLVGFLTSEYT